MAYHGYVVTYSIKWAGKKSSYVYQRFFRAIYGYTQVVSKANGKKYAYYRRGVLSNYPYVKLGRTTVVIPDNALQDIMAFLKSSRNPAHRFTFTGNWSDLLRYTISETYLDPAEAGFAVLTAIQRIHVNLVGGNVPANDLLQRIDQLSPDEVYSLYYAICPTISSNWFPALADTDPELFDRIQRLRNLVSMA